MESRYQKRIQLNGKKQLQTCTVVEAFPFLTEKGHIISFAGAGGKTTLMYELAAFCSGRGWNSLVMTTTHICCPRKGLYAGSLEQAECIWRQGRTAVIGTAEQQNGHRSGKLTMPDHELYEACKARADVVLIEADGAKMLPCKVPGVHEPVLPEECDIVIGVAGLDAIGKVQSRICFREQETEALLGTGPEHRMTEDDLIRIVTSENGTRKNVKARSYFIVLNKGDTVPSSVGNRMLLKLERAGFEQTVLRSLSCFGLLQNNRIRTGRFSESE